MGAPIGRAAAEFFDNKAFDMNGVRLNILIINPVITDQRIGHHHDLAGVGRVSQDFLIAGHGGIKDSFACGFPGLF